jgi:site-specific DNA-methyltransferase (adenine-specific)
MGRQPTSTSAFGVSKRENHDASAFYRRFVAPQLSPDATIAASRVIDRLIVGDARHMTEVADASVALVVTSPPYFAGKQYEEALGQGGVPATYFEYLALLRDVFAECVRVLEPGGRIAVNVANLGRRPYRSLSSDVIAILQDDLALLLRGEIIWIKQRGSSGSCAWGSFQRPANPVLRDTTERIVVASKGRFDRAVGPKERSARGLPSLATMSRDDFMENTLDVWEIPPESATRIGHPAPFPVELPGRLIDLFTYRDDLVLDPFVGAGSTAVAAVRAGRHYVGYDLDASYIALAEERLLAEGKLAPDEPESDRLATAGSAPHELLAARAGEGRSAKELARIAIEAAGFRHIEAAVRVGGALETDYAAEDRNGRRVVFEVLGGHTTYRPGMKRAEAIWKTIGKAAVAAELGVGPFVVLTAGAAVARSTSAQALDKVVGPGRPIAAVIELLDPSCLGDLARLASGAAGL